jgi:uncharacterized membrane protein
MAHTLIHPDNFWVIWTVIIGSTAMSIYLEQHYEWAAKLTGPLLALLFAMMLSNLKIMPVAVKSEIRVPSYEFLETVLVPVAISLLLLKADIRKIFQESGRLFLNFHLSALGTFTGVFLGAFIFRGLIPQIDRLGGVLAGSYTGGAINLFALKEVFKPSEYLISSLLIADNLIMALFFLLYISLPGVGFVRKRFPTPGPAVSGEKNMNRSNAARFWNKKEISLLDIGVSVGIAFAIAAFSTIFSEFMKTAALNPFLKGILSQRFLVIAAVSVCVATLFQKNLEKVNGTEEIGTFFIYMFFFYVGIPSNLGMIVKKAPWIIVFCFFVASINLIFALVLGKVFKSNLEEITIACNANLGGPASAAALAVARGRTDLFLPSVLIGLWGYVVGNYIGYIAGNLLANLL